MRSRINKRGPAAFTYLQTPFSFGALNFGALVLLASANLAVADDFCPTLYKKGVMNFDFMPAFLHADDYNNGKGLTVSSFVNAARNLNPGPPFIYFQRDLVARIPKIGSINYNTFNPATHVEILTDLDFTGTVYGNARTVWPNNAERVPNGILPFEAVVIPQGFLSAPKPGRLTIINMSDPGKQEYLVHQSYQSGAFTSPLDPANSPRAYHNVVWADMDGDGLKDIVTVRSGFRPGAQFHPPFGELVYFKNPGAALNPATPWTEVVLYGGPAAGFTGPDTYIQAADLDNDGNIEILATSFFTGASQTEGNIRLFGAPAGGSWAQVNALAFQLPRVKTISADQGLPFEIQIVDLNNDGKKDILATNHQPDNCTASTSSIIPGRVYALEMPADGDLFNSDWTTHILKDNIRPQPSLAGTAAPGRLAPGRARAFHTVKFLEGIAKPEIVVGGDQAGKVWILRSQDPSDSGNWNYDSSVVFDINAYYGENTTQLRIPVGTPGAGRENSTIGGLAVTYDRAGMYGVSEIYVPVYEGRAIHVLTYQAKPNAVTCTSDTTYVCPVTP